MTTEWADSSTWTFADGEHILIADGAITYCDKCSATYPAAKSTLANLRRRAKELRSITELNPETLLPFEAALAVESKDEGSGFSMLKKYVTELCARL